MGESELIIGKTDSIYSDHLNTGHANIGFIWIVDILVSGIQTVELITQ